MSDLLARLAARAVGHAAAAARPRAPSPFEEPVEPEATTPVPDRPLSPPGPTGGDEGRNPPPVASGSEGGPRCARPLPAAAPPPAAQPVERRVEGARPAARPVARRPRTDGPPPPPEVAVPPAAAPAAPVVAAAPVGPGGPPTTPVVPAPLAVPRAPAVPPTPVVPATPVVPPPVFAARPGAAPAVLAAASPPVGAGDEPAVRIHIGRLEVRASLQEPAAPAQREPLRQEPEALSLSDYLRGGRAR